VLEADSDPSIFLIAVTGAGTTFSAGADLKAARDLNDTTGSVIGDRCIDRIERSKKSFLMRKSR